MVLAATYPQAQYQGLPILVTHRNMYLMLVCSHLSRSSNTGRLEWESTQNVSKRPNPCLNAALNPSCQSTHLTRGVKISHLLRSTHSYQFMSMEARAIWDCQASIHWDWSMIWASSWVVVRYAPNCLSSWGMYSCPMELWSRTSPTWANTRLSCTCQPIKYSVALIVHQYCPALAR